MKEALYGGTHSLVDQSLDARLGAETTNGDGFGVGWYGAPDTPGVFHSIEPAWNDSNLRRRAGHISFPMFVTHIRAAIGGAVQQTNCHPFRHDRWLFMHNGYINEFAAIKRDPMLAVDPSLYAEIKEQADTEVLFYLELTFGLEDDPPTTVEQAIGFVEDVAGHHGVPHPFQGTALPLTTRASGHPDTRTNTNRARSSTRPRCRRYASYIPKIQLLPELSDDARPIVSEPLGNVAGVWNEVPDGSWGVVGPGREEIQPFRPKASTTSGAVGA
jgi:glutamine amidotransferase